MRTLLLVTAVALAASAAAGCNAGTADRVGVSDEAPAPKSTLTITVAADAKGTGLKTWTLTCEPAGGDHPDPAGACRKLIELPRPFDPVPADAICTEIYGGSAVATIKGSWRGTDVDARYTRENGCQISRYDALGVVLPGPIPGQPS